MAAVSGKEYLNRINQINANVWIDGERVKGPISEHTAFSGVMNSQARLYDLQLEDSKPFMTYGSPSTGQRVGTSFLEPKTREDLEQRRYMIQEWAKTSAGMLGRSPDYMNTIVMAISAAAEVFSKQDKRFTQNMRNIYECARENDLCFTHTFINPQVNRAAVVFDDDDSEIISAQTIGKTNDGILIQGARLLATQGGITDEVLVLPAHFASILEEQAYGFSIPTNTSGLKFISRESFRYRESSFDHPLGSRFEEVDTIVVFDNVLVPWDRVFFYNHPSIALEIYTQSSLYPLATHQVLARRIVKTEFILGVAQLLVDAINVGAYLHIHDKISEIIIGLETLKGLLCLSEKDATLDRWGTMVPNSIPLKTAITLYPRLYPRLSEILQSIGASGLVSIPTERDFHSELKNDLSIYLQGASIDALERVKLFRLAWDICMSAFGSRETLYERFFFGDPVRLSSRLYQTYPKEEAIKLVKDFLNQRHRLE